jgi:hypothetical protein
VAQNLAQVQRRCKGAWFLGGDKINGSRCVRHVRAIKAGRGWRRCMWRIITWEQQHTEPKTLHHACTIATILLHQPVLKCSGAQRGAHASLVARDGNQRPPHWLVVRTCAS